MSTSKIPGSTAMPTYKSSGLCAANTCLLWGDVRNLARTDDPQQARDRLWDAKKPPPAMIHSSGHDHQVDVRAFGIPLHEFMLGRSH